MMLRLPAAALVASALLLSSACGRADDTGGTTSSPKPSEPKSVLIEYDQDEAGGVSIAKPADVAQLVGAPNGFKQYVAGLVDASKTPPDDDCQSTVGVAKVDTSGFAAGSMHSCGGAVYIWAKRTGVWQEIWSGQELQDCADMRKYFVPKSIAGNKCYDANKKKVDYAG